MVSALETRINSLRKEQEQVKADIAMIEARLKKAAVIEAKILTIISSPSRLSSRQIEKLEKGKRLPSDKKTKTKGRTVYSCEPYPF